MLYVYIALIAWGVNAVVFIAFILLLRMALRPYLAPLKAMRVTARLPVFQYPTGTAAPMPPTPREPPSHDS